MANPKKMLGSTGVPALCGHVKSIKITAEAAAAGVLQLSDALNQSVTEIEAALNDLPSAASITILPTDWNLDSTINSPYQYYYDIVDSTVKSTDLPIVSVAPSSLDTAADCELCPTCESLTGRIRLYSKSIPSTSIVVECWIVKGMDETNEEGDG